MSGNPGKMDRRIVLQERTLTQDATGSRVETWADVANRSAEKVTTRGREAVLADGEKSQTTQQWRIRYMPALAGADATTNYRLTYQGKIYDITAITEEGRKDRHLIDSTATQATV